MGKWISILVVAGIAALIYGLTLLRKALIQKRCDAFCTAFCELAAHLLPEGGIADSLACENSGAFCPLPPELQPAAIRELFASGRAGDEKTAQLLTVLRTERQEIRQRLTTVNLLAKTYVPVLDRCYALAEGFTAMANDISLIESARDVEDFNYYLHEQAHLKNVTLAVIAGKACRIRLGIGTKQG